jgi:lipoprotein-anchoring transpeptidase ErfK/SrfK
VKPAADGRSRRGGPGGLTGLAGVMLLATLQGCSGSGPSVSSSSSAPTSATGAVSTSASPSAARQPVVQVATTGEAVSYVAPVQLQVTDGTFTSVRVDPVGAAATGPAQGLDGTVSGDGTAWVSTAPPKPAASYQAVATVKDAAGEVRTTTLTFQVAAVPADQKVSFTVTPGDGTTVGIGQPIVVRFLTPVTERAAIQKVMLVDARSGSRAVTGSWHWLGSTEVHWRPQAFWAPGTTVRLDMRIAGVRAAPKRYGRKDYSQTFTVGASHITQVDASTDRLRVYRDGQLVSTWPTGTGRPGLETYSGTYVVLGKAAVVQMDSCSARVTCDKKNPDYYNEKELWATRITASGTFLHAASWDGLLGRANVSHGCIHLRDTDAQEFYNHAVMGDVVIVSHTGRGPQQRIATQDPGLYDWNLPWSTWTAGSAVA